MSSKTSLFTHIDHLGLAVRSIEAAMPLYRDFFGFEFEGIDEVEEQGARVAFFRIGEALVELLEPTRDDSPIARFLEKRGEGIHHVAFATDDIDETRTRAEAAGLRLLSDAPLDGAHGKLISFVHPKDTAGVLVEFCMRRH